MTSSEVTASQQRWRAERDYLNQRRHELTALASTLYPDVPRVGSSRLLARPEWLPDQPVDLADVRLTWSDSAPPAISGLESESATVRPLRSPDERFTSYAEALGDLMRPSLFENRTTYRLLAIDLDVRRKLAFGRGSYFDVVNVCEAAAHELAAHRDHLAVPFRRLVGDPLDIGLRLVSPATSTLTIRRDSATGGASCVLHWRDPARVASGGGLWQVLPVGMFQPSHDARWNEHNDFDLWRSIAREFHEELLDFSEDYGSDRHPIDYNRWPFFVDLEAARSSCALRTYFLGVGVDPLTFATDILTVAVFEADFFDSVFGHSVTANSEGTSTSGVPFTHETVQRFTQAERMQPAGAALLELAWKHRALLL